MPKQTYRYMYIERGHCLAQLPMLHMCGARRVIDMHDLHMFIVCADLICNKPLCTLNLIKRLALHAESSGHDAVQPQPHLP